MRFTRGGNYYQIAIPGTDGSTGYLYVSKTNMRVIFDEADGTRSVNQQIAVWTNS